MANSKKVLHLPTTFPEDFIPGAPHPYDLCTHFATDPDATSEDNKYRAMFAYIIYKQKKIKWIKDEKSRNQGKEPSREKCLKYVQALKAEHYCGYVDEGVKLMNDFLAEMARQEEFTDLIKDNVLRKYGIDELNNSIVNMKERSFSLIDNILISVAGGALLLLISETIKHSLETNLSNNVLWLAWLGMLIIGIILYFRLRKYKNKTN